MRRFKNVSRDLPTAEIDEVISCYAGDLMRGGFDRRWVCNVLKAAATGYSRKVAENNGGGTPINRPGDWNRDGREAEKLQSKTNWYKNPKQTSKNATIGALKPKGK